MQMDEVTQQNAALVEEAASASKSMEDQAAKLVELMGFFRVGGTHVASAPVIKPRAPAPGNGKAHEKAGSASAEKPRTPSAAKTAAAGRGNAATTGEWAEF